MTKDWTGNENSIYKIIGASNHTDSERVENDYYATDPKAIDYLINDGMVMLDTNILEPAAGEGHLSKKLQSYGYNVTSYDLIDRGFCPVKDFFEIDQWDGDIVTNPPFKIAQQFVEHALDIIDTGRQVVMFMKLTFLEGQTRRDFFKNNPPREVLVSSSRIKCAANGRFETIKSSAVAYAWFIWEKGYSGPPVIKWIN